MPELKRFYLGTLVVVLLLIIFSADEAIAMRIFKPKGEMAQEIEKYIDEYPKGNFCEADDFVHIIEKYIPKNLKKQEVAKILKDNGFKVEMGAVGPAGKFVPGAVESLGAFRPYYGGPFLGKSNYSMAIYFDKDDSILKIKTGVNCLYL